MSIALLAVLLGACATVPAPTAQPADVAASWRHHSYGIALPADLLDVMEAEEGWLAAQEKRAPRTRAELAGLIDHTVYRDAVKLRNAR